MVLKDSFLLAYKTVASNKLRSSITIAIIAFGIMALIGIITAIDAMNSSLKDNFATMGANGFTISFKERIRFGNRDDGVQKETRGKKQKKSNLDKPILLSEAEEFKRGYDFPAIVSIALNGRWSYEVHYGDKKTNPNVRVNGGDENYLQVNGFSINAGRNFTQMDVQSGRNVCLLGNDVSNKLFGENPLRAVGKTIHIGTAPYLVLGVLKPKGSSALLRADNVIITSYNSIRKLGNNADSYTIGIAANSIQQVDAAVGYATAIFRGIRHLTPTEDENFVAEKSDKLAQTFIGLLSSITGASGLIGLITLISAAIALMNIMLVAVNERTREIGLIKAIGGKKKNIRQQFLFESVIISVSGAICGIILGVLVGNIFALVLDTGFVAPWGWIITGIVICAVFGLLAGLWPAIKAAKLSPIVALRYE